MGRGRMLTDKDKKKHLERVKYILKGEEPFQTSYERMINTDPLYAKVKDAIKKEKAIRKKGNL